MISVIDFSPYHFIIPCLDNTQQTSFCKNVCFSSKDFFLYLWTHDDNWKKDTDQMDIKEVYSKMISHSEKNAFPPKGIYCHTYIIIFRTFIFCRKKCFVSIVSLVFLLFSVWAINAFTDLEPWSCRFICYRKAHRISDIITDRNGKLNALHCMMYQVRQILRYWWEYSSNGIECMKIYFCFF